MTVPVMMIAAIGSNSVIGAANGIPWRLPSDFANFKRVTMGKPVIMGRKTYESIGKPLPGRTNIIVTRQPGYRPERVLVFDSLTAAMARAQSIAAEDRLDEIVIGGGGEIYREAMPLADRLYITHVDAAPKGDTTFPEIDPAIWVVVEEPHLAPDPRDTAAYRVKVYARR